MLPGKLLKQELLRKSTICCAILLLLRLRIALPPVHPPPAKRHVCILDQLLMCCHAATAPAQASVLPISSLGRVDCSRSVAYVLPTTALPTTKGSLKCAMQEGTHLHLANQPSKLTGPLPHCCCSCAAGVAGMEQLAYSMAQLASEDGELPGACN